MAQTVGSPTPCYLPRDLYVCMRKERGHLWFNGTEMKKNHLLILLNTLSNDSEKKKKKLS